MWRIPAASNSATYGPGALIPIASHPNRAAAVSCGITR